jgi:hypothetical protein
MTAALVPYYEGKGLLRHVDGVGSPSEVGQRIRRALSELTGGSGSSSADSSSSAAAPAAATRGGANGG